MKIVQIIAAAWFSLTTMAASAGVPVIYNLFPTAGTNGMPVAVSGNNFSAAAASNLVHFGAVRASVLAATPTNLTVSVPPGAVFGPVTVTVGGLTAYSSQMFEPTFLGSGTNVTTGNFAPGFTINTSNGPDSTIIADLDGDGKPDVVYVTTANQVCILQNLSTNGARLSAASFAAPVCLSFPTNGTAGTAFRVRAVDLDGDGRIDLIAAEINGNRVSIFHNISTPGTLSTNSFEPAFALLAGNNCRFATAADLDGDGLVDIVALNYSDQTLSLFKNIGTNAGTLNAGSFAAPVTISAPGGPYGAVIADLNGDGKPDLAVVNSDNNTVSIFQNQTVTGVLDTNSFAPRLELPSGSNPVTIVAVDLDGDGWLDLAVGEVQGDVVSVYRNLSTGGPLSTNSFAAQVDFGTPGWMHTLAVADFNGDGLPDLAVVGELSSYLGIFQNTSTPGSFTTTSLASMVQFGTGWNAWAVSAGDLDGDGRPDVVFCNYYDENIEIYQNLMPFAAPPVITAQPTNETVTVGNTAIFTVAAAGQAPLGYQWSFDGTNIAGATNATLTLSNVQLTQAGNYAVVVASAAGSVASSNAVLTVTLAPPSILAQTPGQIVLLGSPAAFGVTAAGSGPLNYFWSRNGALIAGATNASYTLYNAQLTDSGSKFQCLVTNAYGTASSSNVTLKVIDTVSNDLCSGAVVIAGPGYTNQQSTANASSYGDPQPDCVDSFGNGVWYEFTAPATGWLYVDTFGSDFDTVLAAYAGSCDALTEVDCDDDAGGGTASQVIFATTAGTTYYFLAGGYGGHVGNLVFHLNYFTLPVFAVQPANESVVVSSNAVFSPVLTGTLPMSFQWYFNNAPLTDGGRVSGSTNAALAITGVQTNDGGSYQLVASNWVGMATSAVAVLTPVILPPVFVQAPVFETVVVGGNAAFSAVVSGTPPYSFQWYLNGHALADDGVHVAGSTSTSLSITNVVAADAGNYTLVVSNLSGSASATATLGVLVPPAISSQPVGRSVPPGLPTVFTAAVSGQPAPAYQWQLNGTNIPGATGSSYTIAAVTANNLGYYQLVATNAAGVAVSAAAQLTFGPVAAWGSSLYGQCLPPPGLSGVIGVAGTINASLAVKTDGTIAAWGGGAGTNIPAGATNVVAVATSENSANYALRSDGTLAGWNGASAMAAGLSNVVAVAAGFNFGMALRAEGTLSTWGSFSYSTFTNPPAGLGRVSAIACGYQHALALKSDGTVAGWGMGPATNVPAGLSNVVAIAAGYAQSLALKADGSVAAWGTGNGANLPAGLSNVAAIYASGYPQGQSLSLAVKSNGVVVAWGDNNYGETNPPAALNNLVAIAGAAAPYHGLALVSDGSPVILHSPVGLTTYNGRDITLQGSAVGTLPLSYQWLFNGTNLPGATGSSLVISNVQPGSAGYYQLQVSNLVAVAVSVPAPVTVLSNGTPSFLTPVTVSATNVYQGGVATFSSGPVMGSGPLKYQWIFSPVVSNYTAAAGFSPVPTSNYLILPGATNATLVLNPALAVQSGYYCLTAGNSAGGVTSAPVALRVQFARAWGYQAVTNLPVNVTNAIAVATAGYTSAYGDYFALGADGKLSAWANYYSSYGETNVSALSNSVVTAIAASGQSALALKSDGTVSAWGYGYNGQTNPPSGLSGVTAIACGGYHDLVLKNDGTVTGWGGATGYNYGQATNNSAATNVVAIAAGNLHSLALRADGTVAAWGYGSDGSTMVPVTATNLVAIAAGTSFSVALRVNGTVVQWGSGISGYPVPATLSNVVAISAASQHCAALRNDGTVVCWGYEYSQGAASNGVPADLTNVIAIASGSDHDFALLGNRAPVFTVQPWNQSFVLGSAARLTVAGKCVGAQPVTYQWRFNGTNLPGATNDFLVLTNSSSPFQIKQTQTIQAGTYQLVASNAYAVVVSKPAKITGIIPLGVALDTTNLAWTTSGSAAWYGQTNYTHDGTNAARSGGIGALQQTILQTTLATNTAGYLTFWWKVSSEQYYDLLEFRVNGTSLTNISGEVNWQKVGLMFAAGTNVLQWRYSKDATYDSGLDAGFVDQVVFTPAPVFLAQPASVTNYAGTSAYLSGIAAVGGQRQFTGYYWQKNGANLASGNNVAGTSSYGLTLSSVQDADAASYTLIFTNAYGSVTSSPAILTVLDSPPVITSQPASITNYAGTAAAFTVSAVGAVPMSYQWQKNGANLGAGGTVSGSPVLALTNVQAADAAGYAVILTNVYGSVTSAPAALVVIDGPPVITSQPTNLVVPVGRAAVFVAAASGTAPLSYQWQFNGASLPGATGSSLTLSNASRFDTGSYQVVITNTFGAATSSVASLIVVRSWVVAWGSLGQDSVPVIPTNVLAAACGSYHELALTAGHTVVAWGDNSYGQLNVPAGLTNVAAIAAGAYHSLALLADGTVTAWGYDGYGECDVPAGLAGVTAVAAGWEFSLALLTNGTIVAWGDNNYGETNVPAGLTNVVGIASDAASSHSLALQADGTVVAWGANGAGQASVPTGLTNGVAIATGGNHSLAVQAGGTVVAWGDDQYGEVDMPPLLTNAVAVAGGALHSLALQSTGTVMGWGYDGYSQTDIPGSLTNTVAIAAADYSSLAIQNDGSPVIQLQPVGQTVASNATVSLTVTAVGAPNLNYQWRKNGVNLTDGGNVAGTATASLIISNVQLADMAAYSVVVTNAVDSVTSAPAAIILQGPPVITAQPASQTVNYGVNVTFQVAALGNPVPTYQWWWNGTNPVGGNSPVLALTAVGRAQNGTYTVLVTNALGGVFSSNAVLKVIVPQNLGPVAISPDGSLHLTSADAGGGLLTPADLPNFEAQTSSNLVNWTALPGSLSLTNGTLILLDGSRSNAPARFYRILEH